MLSLRHWPRAALTLGRTFGPRGLALRTVHELRVATGGFRRGPRHPRAQGAGPAAHPFRVDAGALRRATEVEPALERAGRVVAGKHPAYRWDWRPLPRSAEEWLRHPGTGAAFPARAPWWGVPHLDPALGDIKDLWEPARFAWAYDLVRAHRLTDDPRYARAFVERFEQWRESSPPFHGPHWACGQETAIRAVALLYAEANLFGSDPAPPSLVEVLAASGERISDALGYAVSQRNNHAISEAVGLLVLGDRLLGRHPEAAGWLRRGRAWLERLVREQFAPDGWYIQHSFTYLRLALDQCVVAQRVLAARGASLSPGAVARVRAAVELLLAVMDPGSGEVPNHGPNDGAFVHPITLGGYRDFRPAVSAAAAVFGVPLPPEVRVDAEALAWLGAEPPPREPGSGEGVRSGGSGWAAARVGGTSVFLRAGRYASRPGHLDALHVDVRLEGREVVVDPGTFAYNAPAPWRNGLVGARVHNGPLLDEREPGVRGPRFLWYLWPDAVLLRAEWDGREAVLVAEIPGRVRRVVRATRGGVRVEDEALDSSARTMAVRWLLHPDAPPEQVRVEGGARLRAAEEGSVQGWFSPLYGKRIASRWVEAERDLARGPRLVTEISTDE